MAKCQDTKDRIPIQLDRRNAKPRPMPKLSFSRVECGSVLGRVPGGGAVIRSSTGSSGSSAMSSRVFTDACSGSATPVVGRSDAMPPATGLIPVLCVLLKLHARRRSPA